ncbi:MAG: GIY-YIG nuclease family protein [Flammeovirgaceae bacterium]
MAFYVYILQSHQNLSFYKGSTEDLERRLAEHNDGKTTSTRRYLPWVLVWFAQKASKQEAIALERKLKNLSVERTIDFIERHPPPVGLFEVHGVQR